MRPFRIFQSHLQRDCPNVALPPPHIPLRSKIRLRRLVDDFPRNHSPSRQPHPQRVPESNVIGVCLRNRRQYPCILEVQHRHDRLPGVHHFAFACRSHQDRPCYRRIDLRISQTHFRFLQLRHRVIHLCPRRCHGTLRRRRLFRPRDCRIQIRLRRRHLVLQCLNARLLRLQIHLCLHLLLLRGHTCFRKSNRPQTVTLHPRQSRFRLRQLRSRRLQSRLRICHISRRRPFRRLPRVFGLADFRPHTRNRRRRRTLLSLQFRRIQQRNQIPLLDLRSFFDQQLCNPPLYLRAHHNLIRIHCSHQDQVFPSRRGKNVIPRSDCQDDRQDHHKFIPRTHRQSPCNGLCGVGHPRPSSRAKSGNAADSAPSSVSRCSPDKQRPRNKIENKRPPLPYPLHRQRVHFQQRLHQRRRAEIKNNYSHHRGQEIHRIHHPKFPRLNALPQ